MSSEKQQGFVLYFEALDALSHQVDGGQISAEDAFSVVAALGRFAQTGEEPDAGSLSPVASMAYAMMVGGVKKSLAKYAERKKKAAEAASARWNGGASNAQSAMREDANACGRMHEHEDACRGMQEHANDADTDIDTDSDIDVEVEDNKPRAREGGLHDQIRRNQIAMTMIEQYRLPDVPSTLDAMLEDLERFGEETVQKALREACNANSRDRLSVNFYRSVLSRMTGGPSSRGAPRAAPAFEQKGGKEFFDGFEVYE